jgi:hypothetical protein
MRRNRVRTIALSTFVQAVVLGATWQAQAQDAKGSYPNMAPLDQYVMTERDAEIALARSAAPESISGDAEVLVLGRHGYETAVKGTNGSYVSWNDRGCSPSTSRSSGTPTCDCRSA